MLCEFAIKQDSDLEQGHKFQAHFWAWAKFFLRVLIQAGE